MHFASTVLAVTALCAAACPALAEESITLADLQAKSPVKLSREELATLLPGAKMTRINEKGNLHIWTNEPDGHMIVSTSNHGKSSSANTAKGQWKLSEEGRFCMTVEWRRNEPEDSCRFILKTTDGYYAVSALEPLTRTAYKVTISK